jgi:hypothetical protein
VLVALIGASMIVEIRRLSFSVEGDIAWFLC